MKTLAVAAVITAMSTHEKYDIDGRSVINPRQSIESRLIKLRGAIDAIYRLYHMPSMIRYLF